MIPKFTVAKLLLSAIGFFSLVPAASACVECYAGNICGPAAGFGFLRCTIGCGTAFCACVPSGPRCSVGTAAGGGPALASNDRESAVQICAPTQNGEVHDAQQSMAGRWVMLQMSDEQPAHRSGSGFVQVADTGKQPSCRMGRPATGDAVVRCGPPPTGERMIQAMRGDVGTLIQVAEVDPQAALAAFHLHRSDAVELSHLDGGMIVVPALSRDQTMQALTRPPGAPGERLDKDVTTSTKFRISIEWSGPRRAVLTVRLASDDPARLQGGVALEHHQVAGAVAGHYALRGWVPLAPRGT